MREGTPDDLLAYVDGALLVDLWANWYFPWRYDARGSPSSRVVKWYQAESAHPIGTNNISVEVAQEFFALKEARGYLLAGGSALLALGLINRPTQDLDFFTNDRSVTSARDALLAAIRARAGWSLSLVHDSDTFCRIEVCNGANQQLLVDLAVDSPPTDPPTMTVVGPAPMPIERRTKVTGSLWKSGSQRFRRCVHAVQDIWEAGAPCESS